MTNKEAIIAVKEVTGMSLPWDDRHYEALQMAIKALEQQWIPCSERLPEEYGNYLVSIDGKEPDIGTINPNDPRGWSLCAANGFYWASDKALNIIAWMPLPAPYEERLEE